MLTFSPPSPDDLSQLNTAFNRAGLVGQLPFLEVAHDRQGRFSVCCIQVMVQTHPGLTTQEIEERVAIPLRQIIYHWGAARLDSQDQDAPAVGRRLALHKAGKSLIRWVKDPMKAWKTPGLVGPDPICDPGFIKIPQPQRVKPDPSICATANRGWRDAQAEKPEPAKAVLGIVQRQYSEAIEMLRWSPNHGWKTWENGSPILNNVSYWRPLPDPPA